MPEKTVFPAPKALGPGDSVREEPRTVREAPAALGPGDGDGHCDEYEGVALPPLGPGDVTVPRPVIRRRRAVTGA